jgi:hypothetical protein
MGTGNEQRGVFVRIPRTASTSIEGVLESHPHVILNSRSKLLPPDPGHRVTIRKGLATIWRETLGDEEWRRLFTFAFVRNPFERTISSWSYVARRYDSGDLIADPMLLEWMGLETKKKGTGELALDQYLELLDANALSGQSRWHSCPQSVHILDDRDQLAVDFVGRFENLQRDFDTICDALEIPRTMLPQLNRSARPASGSLITSFPDRRRIVERVYARDLEYFDSTGGRSST